MDDIDRSVEDQQRFLDAHIAAARRITPKRTSAHECTECGCTIPEARRVALPGVQTCVDCAVVLEGKRLRGLS